MSDGEEKNPLALPTFPTTYGGKEQKRLEELQKQKTEMEQVYQQKFAPGAWAKAPVIEKAARGFVANLPWITKPLGWITPTSWGFDYGVTPEQAQRQMADMEIEYKELVRREKVTRVLPELEFNMIVAALSGQPLMTMAEILPEGFRGDFTEDEKAYLVGLGERLVHASPEDIMSGAVLGFQPSGKLADYADIYKMMPELTPQQIMSTVAFSKNIDQIGQALQMAYPPQVEPGAEVLPSEKADESRNWLKEKAKALGVRTVDTDTPKELAVKVNNALADQNKGTTHIMTNKETGDMMIVTEKDNGGIWMKGEEGAKDIYLGKLDESGQLVPGEEIESKAKDILDALRLSLVEFANMSKEYFISVLPNTIFAELPAVRAPADTKEAMDKWMINKSKELQDSITSRMAAIGVPEDWRFYQSRASYQKVPGFKDLIQEYKTGMDVILKEYQQRTTFVAPGKSILGMNQAQIDAVNSFNKEMRDYFTQLYLASEEKHIQWLIDHPELQPRAEWADGTPHWDNPAWYAYIVAKNATPTIASLGTGVLVTAATGGNVPAGSLAAFAVINPSNTQDVYNDLAASGADPEKVASLATVMGGIISVLDSAGDIPIMKFSSPVMMKLFKKELTKQLADLTMKDLAVKGLVNFTVQEFAESSTEVLQTAIQNASAKTFDPKRQVTEGLWQVFYETNISVAPFALFGVGSTTYSDIHSQMPKEIQDRMGTNVDNLKKAGLDEGKAQLIAVANEMETEEGRARVKEALTKAEETVPPVSEKRVAKITNLESKLVSLNKELDTFTNSLEIQQDRLAKLPPFERTEQQETIANLQSRVDELNDEKDAIIKNIAKLRKAAPVPAKGAVPLAPEIVIDEGSWNSISQTEKVILATKAGIAKTSSLLNWSDLTDVQRERLQGITEEAPSVERTEPLRRPAPGEPPIIIPGAIPDILAYSAEGAPKLQSLEDWLAETKAGFVNKPEALALIKLSEKVLGYQAKARTDFEALKQRIASATTDEAKAATKKEMKSLARKVGIRYSTLMTKTWDGMTPNEVQSLTVGAVPDRSLKFYAHWKLLDSRLVFGEIEKETGLPFQTVYERTRDAIGYVQRLQDKFLDRIVKNPIFKGILTDRAALARVTLELNSRDPGSKVVRPEGLTDIEGLLADEIEAVYKEWQPIVRCMRFIEAYEENHQIKEIKSRIKDAPEENLKEAKRIYEAEGLDALWAYLFDKTWGVIESGYDPREVHNPSLRVRLPPLTAVRGGGRLISRDSPEFMLGDLEGVIKRYDTYNKSMGVRWYLKDEIESLAKLLAKTETKWEKPREIEQFLKGYVRELQGIPEMGNPFYQVIRKIQQWAYPTIFMHPWLGFRNVLQPLWSFPYRQELFRSFFEYDRLPSSLKAKAAIRFATVIDQSGRPIRDWLFQGEDVALLGDLPEWAKIALVPTKVITKPLDMLSNLMGKIPTMAISDRLSRSWAFRSGLIRAWRATEQYQKDGNIARWLKNSGATYLSSKQQEYIVGLLLRDKVAWAVPGLHDMTGQEAATIKVSEEIVNNTLYLYERSSRAMIEWGAVGRAFGSLLVFPRSTAQMCLIQMSKVFSKDSTAAERVDGTRKIIMLWVAGELLSQLLMSISGRRRKEYSLTEIFTWELGGLNFSLARDVTSFLGDLVTAAFGDAESKDRVLSKLPSETSRLGDTLVGGYRILMDTLEAWTDERQGIDVRFLRQVRAFFDENYTPEQQEAASRTLVEKFQHMLTGAPDIDPTVIEQAQRDLILEEQKLGTIDLLGNFYTINNFGNRIEALLKPVPDFMVTDGYGFSDLVIFYDQCRDDWGPLYKLPPNQRNDWRRANPEAEAELIFWGKYGKSVFSRGSTGGKGVRSLLNTWVQMYGITEAAEPRADWEDLVPIFQY